jgi:hypothetical protein
MLGNVIKTVIHYLLVGLVLNIIRSPFFMLFTGLVLGFCFPIFFPEISHNIQNSFVEFILIIKNKIFELTGIPSQLILLH